MGQETLQQRALLGSGGSRSTTPLHPALAVGSTLFLPKPIYSPAITAGSCLKQSADQCLPLEGKFKSHVFLLWGTLFPATWNKPQTYEQLLSRVFKSFWWTEGFESVCSHGSRESPGISKTYSRKGHFSLALSTGQWAEIVKASGRAPFPLTFASPWKKEKLPFSQRSSEEKLLPSTACRSSYLLSLFRWMGRFCWRNTSLLTFEMPSFLPTTKIPRVAAQTGKLKWSRFPAPAALEEILQGKKEGEHRLKLFLPCFHVPTPDIFLCVQIFRRPGVTGL